MPDRLDLIAERAAAMPVRIRTCAFCRLEYRHTAGVMYRGGWYCDAKCARAKRPRLRGDLLVASIFGAPPRT